MEQPNRVRFGRNVRRLRLAKSLTQEGLAELAGLHSTYVGGIERGERNVGLDNILKIAKALGHQPAALFEDFSCE